MLADVKFESVTSAAATIEGTVQAFRDHVGFTSPVIARSTQRSHSNRGSQWAMASARCAHHPGALHQLRVCVLVGVPYPLGDILTLDEVRSRIRW